jgi:hypothetical protein
MQRVIMIFNGDSIVEASVDGGLKIELKDRQGRPVKEVIINEGEDIKTVLEKEGIAIITE